MVSLNNLIHIDDRRVFIDIAKEGCGNGCSYCYVDTANKPQVLWDTTDILSAINMLENWPPFRKNASSYIISLCPSTEPLKSKAACELIYIILCRLIPFGCFIQLATKEQISDDFLFKINDKLLFEGQLTINISINCLSTSHKFETKAVRVDDRLKNITIIKRYDKVKSCILIKPFIQGTYDDLNLFIEKLSLYTPNYVCVGISFNSNCSLTQMNNRDFYEKHFSKQDPQTIYYFMKRLSDALLIPVFPSSLCVLNQYTPGYILPNASRTLLCMNCGKCTKEKET